MANYEAYARTNYFEVSDLQGLKDSVEKFGHEVAVDDINPELYCLLAQDESGWGSYDCQGNDTVIDFCFKTHVMSFVKQGQVVVVKEIGREKLRYLAGDAFALVRYGVEVKRVQVSLDDIYALAAKEFDKPLASITLAEY